MIHIRTCAYNAEKTLERTINSVLCQTYQDFTYYILDNGSTDGTRAIVQAYAKRDRRIIPYYNKVNRDVFENPDFWNLSKNIPEGDSFCILDADDAYEPSFFEEMLRFMIENRLQMAACGTVFLDGATGQAIGRRVLERNAIIRTPEQWDALFPAIHWNLRQVWGKLYSPKAAMARYETETPNWFPKAYGGDTINTMNCAMAAGSFGVYAKPLHTYTVSKKSVSYQWIQGREDADVILHQKTVEFLQQTSGRVSERNLHFLYGVYFNAIKDTIQVLVYAQLPVSSKMDILRKILANDITKAVQKADITQFGVGSTEKESILSSLIQWLETLRTMFTARDTSCLSSVYSELNPDFDRLIQTENLLWYLRKSPQAVSAIAEGNHVAALQCLSKLLADGHQPAFAVELAQTLAALLQNQEAYIFYSKLLIKSLIRRGDLARAREELAAWETILPEDTDLMMLRKKLPI